MSSPDESAGAEEAAWAELLLAWEDEARHRAYLARFADLDGLAVAGRRYRDVLETRPGDAMAARFRDEVVKRAMVQGLVALPRAAPPPSRRNLVRVAAFAFAFALAAAAWYVARRLGLFLGAGP